MKLSRATYAQVMLALGCFEGFLVTAAEGKPFKPEHIKDMKRIGRAAVVALVTEVGTEDDHAVFIRDLIVWDEHHHSASEEWQRLGKFFNHHAEREAMEAAIPAASANTTTTTTPTDSAEPGNDTSSNEPLPPKPAA